MPLPGGLTTITVTGSYVNVSGTAQAGSVSFTPTSAVSDVAGRTILTQTAATVALASGAFSLALPCTDNAGLLPLGWAYTVNVGVAGAQQAFTCYLPSALGATVDISALAPVTGAPAPSGVSYIPDAGTVPAAGPSGGGGFLYSHNGALFWIGGANTRTKIAPA